MRLFNKVDGTIDRQDRALWTLLPFDALFPDIAVNPYVTMRENIEAALADSAALAALGFTLRKWTDPFLNIADQPAADQLPWLRVESESIEDDDYWTNTHVETTHRLRIVGSLGVHGGMRMADIEEAWYQIQKALAPLTRDHSLMATQIPALESFSFEGGPVAVGESGQERQTGTSNLAWATIGTAVAMYHQDYQTSGWSSPARDDDFSTSQPTNPYARMRRNIEYALANSTYLTELGFTLRGWNDKFLNIADQPAADQKKWLRVDTDGLEDNEFFGNGLVETTQTMRVIAALPVHGGLKAEDIENAWWGIQRTLAPLSRVARSKLNEDVGQISELTFEGGEIAVAGDDQERQHSTKNLAWGHVGRVRATMLHRIADL